MVVCLWLCILRLYSVRFVTVFWVSLNVWFLFVYISISSPFSRSRASRLHVPWCGVVFSSFRGATRVTRTDNDNSDAEITPPFVMCVIRTLRYITRYTQRTTTRHYRDTLGAAVGHARHQQTHDTEHYDVSRESRPDFLSQYKSYS